MVLLLPKYLNLQQRPLSETSFRTQFLHFPWPEILKFGRQKCVSENGLPEPKIHLITVGPTCEICMLCGHTLCSENLLLAVRTGPTRTYVLALATHLAVSNVLNITTCA